MNPEIPLEQVIRELEMQTLTPTVRTSPEQLSRLLASDFMEIGQAGHRYNKQKTLTTLSDEPGDHFAVVDFEVKSLAPDVALATYSVARLTVPATLLEWSRRNSIWRFNNGQWQMTFAQGTATTDTERQQS
jgi:hypothetical protein